MPGGEFIGWSGTRSGSGGGGGADPFADRVIRVALTASNGTTTISSIASIPVGAIVWECGVDVTTGFIAGTTIEVGQSGHLTEFQGTGDNTASSIGLYQKFQDTTPAIAGQIVVTVVSTATSGVGFAYVRYSEPQS